MNAGKTDEQTQENTVPHWLLPYTCNNQTQRCQCNARLTPKGRRPFFGPFLDIGQAIVDAIFVQKISNFW
jgi:hypothetical protein